MRACVWLDDRMCSGWFVVEQVLRQECVLVLLLFTVFFAAVIKVAYKRSKPDKEIMCSLVHLKKKKRPGGAGGSNCPRASPGDAALGYALR